MTTKALTIEKRLKRLEDAVFGTKGKNKGATKQTASEFSGATGGIRFLISKGFFNKKHSRSEVRSELAENGYHYSGPAVQMALNRQSGRNGLLAWLTEGGKKLYVKRK
jgi:hypothetical protein